MTPLKIFSIALIVPCLSFLTAAAPVRKPPKTPITVKNAHLIRPVHEVPRSAYRVIRSPKNGELIVLDFNNSVEVVDDVQLKTIRTLAKGTKPSDFAISADGKYQTWIATRSKAYLLKNTKTGKTITIQIGDSPGSASFSPDGKILAIGHTWWHPKREGAGTSRMRFYDLQGKLIRVLKESDPGGLRPVFSPDGKILALGNRNENTRLFEVATGKLLHELDKRMTQEIAFSPDGKTLATGYVDGTLRLWDVKTGKLLHTTPSTCREVYSVDWSPKGDVLVSAGLRGKIVLWDPKTMKKLKEIDAPSWVIQVRFTADGARLVSAGTVDNNIRNRQKKMVIRAIPKDGGR